MKIIRKAKQDQENKEQEKSICDDTHDIIIRCIAIDIDTIVRFQNSFMTFIKFRKFQR